MEVFGMTNTRRIGTAILVMAVLFIGLIGSGCVTKRDIEDLDVRLERIEQQTASTQKAVARMDSLIAASSEADNRLRNEVSTSVDDLREQLASLLQNYNDLMREISRIRQKAPVVQEQPSSSPGAQVEQNSAACDQAYDDAFILVRKGEYEKAISGFRDYLTKCPRHQSVANAYYWIGECQYSLERYQDAVTEFEGMLKNYPKSVNAGRAMYKLARSKQELGQKADAKKVFQQIIDQYPNTLEAEQSKDRIKEIK
jgi:tol-pal system protein YbgF